MKLHAIVPVLVGVLFLGMPAAQAGTHISVFGDGTFSTTKTTGQTDPKSMLGLGGGAQVEFGLGPMAGLEIGAVYLGRKTGDSTANLTFNYVQIPVQLRYWVGKYLTLGAGGYYALPVGDIKAGGSSLPGGGSIPYATAGFKKNDYGLLGSVGFNAPVGPTAAVFAEGRYALGLDDQNATAIAGTTTKWQDIQILVGLRFGMGK
jgi:hypothetical protein